jgi:hypothetical protein
MRDGPWMLVELYDDDRADLYDLSRDIGERHDVADRHPDRVASMRKALDEWRRVNEVQHNTANPDCDETLFRKLYVDVDPSQFDPAAADEEEWTRIRAWRRGMDEATRTAPKRKCEQAQGADA